MAKLIKPIPSSGGSSAQTDEENVFTEVQTAPAWQVPLPSVKGAPDTISLRNSTDVPVIQYAPEHITVDVYRPVVPELIDKTASYEILATEAYNYIFTNTGAAGAVTLTLPAAVVGMEIYCFVAVAQNLIADGNGAEQIINAAGTLVNTLTSATVNSSITLRCFREGTWSAVSTVGTWA